MPEINVIMARKEILDFAGLVCRLALEANAETSMRFRLCPAGFHPCKDVLGATAQFQSHSSHGTGKY